MSVQIEGRNEGTGSQKPQLKLTTFAQTRPHALHSVLGPGYQIYQQTGRRTSEREKIRVIPGRGRDIPSGWCFNLREGGEIGPRRERSNIEVMNEGNAVHGKSLNTSWQSVIEFEGLLSVVKRV